MTEFWTIKLSFLEVNCGKMWKQKRFQWVLGCDRGNHAAFVQLFIWKIRLQAGLEQFSTSQNHWVTTKTQSRSTRFCMKSMKLLYFKFWDWFQLQTDPKWFSFVHFAQNMNYPSPWPLQDNTSKELNSWTSLINCFGCILVSCGIGSFKNHSVWNGFLLGIASFFLYTTPTGLEQQLWIHFNPNPARNSNRTGRKGLIHYNSMQS